MTAQVDTRRMVETTKIGFMRSTGSAVRDSECAPTPALYQQSNKDEDDG